MGKFVEQLRHVCALGAFQSVLAIDKALPVLHAGPGCGAKLWMTLGLQNGCQGSGHTGGHSIPCTNITEKEVIFGGNERLREVLGNSFKIMDADLYVVLTGCTAEIVGDDVSEVVGEFKDQGYPVIYAETGGFKGSNIFGHELVLEAIINQYLEPSDEIEEGLINIWSVVPFQDTFWTGNLEELSRLVGLLGLKPNVIFGPGNGLDAVNKIPKAQYNLLISPWVGLKNVIQLEEKFGTPYIHCPVLPIGPTETGKFLRKLAEATGVSSQKVEAVIKKQEDKYYYYIERSADTLLETRLLPKYFVTATDSFYALGISRFLINDLGLLPSTQFITDNPPEELRIGIENEFKDFVDGITTDVVFTNDGGEVREALRKIPFRGRPLILGSAWDRVIARELNGYQLSISTPISDRMVLSRAYVGYEGALRLTEDIYSVILNSFQ